MGLIRFVLSIVVTIGVLIVSIGAFFVTLAIGLLAAMAAIGGGVIALVTFGVIDYRKSKNKTKNENKKSLPPEDL